MCLKLTRFKYFVIVTTLRSKATVYDMCRKEFFNAAFRTYLLCDFVVQGLSVSLS